MKLIAAAILVFFTPVAVAAELDTTPVAEGKPAPFTGVLVREQRFIKLLDAELKVPTLEGRLLVEQKFSAGIEAMYKSKLEDAAKPPPWYQTPFFNFMLGIVVGGAIAAGAIAGGAKIAESLRAGR